MSATASQAWAILRRHARDEIATLRLQDLCQDNERVSGLVCVHNSPTGQMMMIDLSRQRMTLETLNHLLKLSVTRGVRQRITRLAWGQNNPDAPLQVPRRRPSTSSKRRAQNKPHYHHHQQKEQPTTMPSMHLALRAPKGQGLHMITLDGVNALTASHREWDRLERLSESIRRGTCRGVSGKMLRDVVVVGSGVAIQALQFIAQALEYDETATMATKFGLDNTSGNSWSGATSRLLQKTTGIVSTQMTTPTHASTKPRKIHFLTSLDPLAASKLVAQLDAGSTMVITFALNGNEETGLATHTLKTWLLRQLSSSSSASSFRRADSILSKHVLFVTGNNTIAASINKPESVFLVPEHSRCEAFISFSSATLLPMSLVYGWSICEQFLAGGHDLDCHFVETNPRHNLPVLLALTDVWNSAFLGQASQGRLVTPFTQSMKGFPAFVAALEAQTCSGNGNSSSCPSGLSCSGLVLDGGSDSIYDGALYQSSKMHYSELVMVMNTQLKANTARTLGGQGGQMKDIYSLADALICSLFGHADELAFGKKEEGTISPYKNLRQFKSRNVSPGQSVDATGNHQGLDKTMETSNQSDGNRPSALLICGILDAFTLGQLIACSEHRAVVKAWVWGMDPFAKQAGHATRTTRAGHLRQDLEKICLLQQLGSGSEEIDEEDKDGNNGGLNLSSKTLLGHYARVRG